MKAGSQLRSAGAEELLELLERAEKAVVAAVTEFALGGGLEVTMRGRRERGRS